MSEGQDHSFRNRILREVITHAVIFGAALLFLYLVFFSGSVPKWFRMQMPFLLGIAALAVAYVMTVLDVGRLSTVAVARDPALSARWLISRVGVVYAVLMLAAAFAGLFGDPPTRGWYFLVPVIVSALSFYGLWSVRSSGSFSAPASRREGDTPRESRPSADS